jgi:predicted permease
MGDIFQPIAQIFLLVLCGTACRRFGLIDPAGRRVLSNLVFYLVLPCMLFSTAAQADFASYGQQAAICFVAGLLVPLPAYAVGMAAARLARVTQPQEQVIRVGAALANTAFFGIPICAALWGERGALLASFYDQGITIPMFLLGPLGYAVRPNSRALRGALLNPIILSMTAGIAFRFTGFTLPPVLAQPVEMVGGMTAPLALILVGALLEWNRSESAEPRSMTPLALLAGSRLVFAPLLVLGIAVLLGLEKPVRQVVVLQAAMPTSVLGTLMAYQYRSDAALAVQGNLLTVAVSVITLSVFAAILR